MNTIVRAWKDETYRQGLSVEAQAVLPANPAGEIELTDIELEAISGACGQSNNNSQNGANKIRQDVDQKAFATFGNNSIVVDSYVECRAKNDADLDADIRDHNFGDGY